MGLENYKSIQFAFEMQLLSKISHYFPHVYIVLLQERSLRGFQGFKF